MSARYAESTSVSTDASRMEIERTLRRYKAESFAYATNRTGAVIMFTLAERRIKFELPMPDPQADGFTLTRARGTRRTPTAAEAAWEQACWRVLALVIKAKLEAVAAGITTIEDEFLAHTVIPGGATVGELMRPQIALAYSRGKVPEGLIALAAPKP